MQSNTKRSYLSLIKQGELVCGYLLWLLQFYHMLSLAFSVYFNCFRFPFSSVQRTKVIDDESDYFSVNNRWLSDDHRRLLKEREERLREERRGTHKKTKLTLDIAGRRVIEEDQPFGGKCMKNKLTNYLFLELYSEESIRDIKPPDTSSYSRENCSYEMSQEGICNPLLPIDPPQVRPDTCIYVYVACNGWL